MQEIAKAWAPRLDLEAQRICEYLTSNIDYSLDEENLQGLKLFYRYAAECNVLPPAPELRFVEEPQPSSGRAVTKSPSMSL